MPWFRSREKRNPNPGSPLWGGIHLPVEAARDHFLAVGCPGSGKGLTIQLLMQSVLPVPGTGGSRRALVFDGKTELLPVLKGIASATELLVANPLDARCAAWALAKDIDTPAAAQELACILIPEPPGDSPFYPTADRAIITGILTALQKRRPGRWSLGDLLAAAWDEQVLGELLAASPARCYLECAPVDTRNILVSLRAYLQPYELVAAAWEHTQRTFSLREWLQSESILILGMDCGLYHSMQVINRALFQRFTTLLLSQEYETAPEEATWVFLDDMDLLLPLPGLEHLLIKGRCASAHICLGLQSITSLHERAPHCDSKALLSWIGNLAVLRLHSSADAQWASSWFRDRHEDRPGVSSYEFLKMPPCTSVSGLTGFFLTRHTGLFKKTLSPTFLEKHLPRPCPDYPAFIPWPTE